MIRLKNKFSSTFKWFHYMLPQACPRPAHAIAPLSFQLVNNHSSGILQYLINFAELALLKARSVPAYAG